MLWILLKSPELCSLAGKLDEVVTVRKCVALTVQPFVNCACTLDGNEHSPTTEGVGEEVFPGRIK